MTETTRPAQRILTIDVIRGIAVMGIFSVNVIDFSLIQQAYLNPAAAGWHGPADIALWFTNHILIDEKMRTLFSILFGASNLLVYERALAKGESGLKVHFGRMGALLLLGLAHFYLIWQGDILIGYSVAGMVVYRLIRKSPAVQLRWAAVLLAVAIGQFSFITWQFYSIEHRVAAHTAKPDEIKKWRSMRQMAIPEARDAAQATATLRAPWPTRTARRFAKEKFQPIGGALAFLPETVGLMLIGMAGFRSGFLTGEWERRRYRQVAIAGLSIGILFSVTTGLCLINLGFPPWLLIGANYGFGLLPHLAMALGYASLIMLAMRPGGWLTTRIAAAGRAAFSNYLGTSIVAALVFYGDGLVLFGQLSRFQSWLVVPMMWLLMLSWSKPWLDHFNYGPFEWLWRSLARGKLQPMRKGARPDVAMVAA